MNQSIQSPTRKMDSIKRIGQPAEKGKSAEEENIALKPIAPSLFGLPTTSNYDNVTGFVHCCVSRYSKNKYHLSFQAEDSESVSVIANKIKSSRTSNYHLFDALRGGENAKVSNMLC